MIFFCTFKAIRMHEFNCLSVLFTRNPLNFISCLHCINISKTRRLSGSICWARSWNNNFDRRPTPSLLTGVSHVRIPFVRTMAGHSHWQNIRRIKSAKDKEKSDLISYHCSQIRKAIHEGGSSDPKLNQRLVNAIEAAKQARVPGSTIEATYKRAENCKLKPCTVELRGPGNSYLIVETEAIHPSIVTREIKIVCRRHGNSQHVSDGSVHKCFEHKGVVTVSAATLSGAILDTEKAMDLAIEAGAQEVNTVQDNKGNTNFEFVCSVEDYYRVKHYLENNNSKILSASIVYIPSERVQLSEDEFESFMKLQEKLESMTDVTVLNIFDNLQ